MVDDQVGQSRTSLFESPRPSPPPASACKTRKAAIESPQKQLPKKQPKKANAVAKRRTCPRPGIAKARAGCGKRRAKVKTSAEPRLSSWSEAPGDADSGSTTPSTATGQTKDESTAAAFESQTPRPTVWRSADGLHREVLYAYDKVQSEMARQFMRVMAGGGEDGGLIGARQERGQSVDGRLTHVAWPGGGSAFGLSFQE